MVHHFWRYYKWTGESRKCVSFLSYHPFFKENVSWTVASRWLLAFIINSHLSQTRDRASAFLKNGAAERMLVNPKLTWNSSSIWRLSLNFSKCGEDAEKLGHSYIAGRRTKWYHYPGKHCGTFLKKKKDTPTTTPPRDRTLGHLSRWNENLVSHKNLYSSVAVLLVIAPNWEQPKRSSVADWLSKLWSIHTVE